MKTHKKLEADSLFITALELCDLRLMNNRLYPWVILVPRIEGAIELTDLTMAQQHQLMDEINQVSQTLTLLYEPHKINIATLGNIVRQLHIHVIARYTTDPAWPAPVWGHPATPYDEESKAATLQRFRES